MSRQSEWKKRNRPAMTAYRKKWMKEHPGKKSEYDKRNRDKNKDRLNEKRRRFRKANPEYDKMYARRIREEVLSHYGGKCACCGEGQYEFMTIDHMNGGGSKHRRELKQEGAKFIFWLRRNGYPEGFQVLCNNCNCALGRYGFCPHRPEIRRPVLRKKQI